MKKVLKKLITAIFVIIIILSISCVTMATTISDFNGQASGEFNKVGNAAVKVLSTFGMVLSVIVLIVLGIKYMIGSAEEKADYKKTLLPYVIGATVTFGASSIASVIYNIAKDL